MRYVRLRAAVVGLLLLTAPNVGLAQDYISQNPELDRLMKDSPQKDREQLNKMLSSMSAEERQKFIQGLVDVGLKIEREGVTIETVFARFHKSSADQKGLTV